MNHQEAIICKDVPLESRKDAMGIFLVVMAKIEVEEWGDEKPSRKAL